MVTHNSFPIQWMPSFLPPSPSMASPLPSQGRRKIVMITGVNFNGIGYEIAKAMLTLGYHLIIVDKHSDEHMKALSKDLHLIAPSEDLKIHTISADLTSFDDLRAVTLQFQKITSSLGALDILIHNAGGMIDGLTSEGYSKTVALCLHAPIILTHELIPFLSPSSRIVVTCSSTSNMIYLLPSFQVSQLESYTPQAKDDPSILNYIRAKYCLKLWVKLLHSKMIRHEIEYQQSGQEILITSFHPGAVGTNIFTPLRPFLGPTVFNILMSYLKLSLRTPQEGSMTGVYLAASSDLSVEDGGGYFFDCKRVLNEKLTKTCEEDFLKELERYSDNLYKKFKSNEQTVK